MSTPKRSTPKTRTIAEIRRRGCTPVIVEVWSDSWRICMKTPDGVYESYCPLRSTPKAAWKAAAEAFGV